MEFLVFQIYAPMVSWGDIAVGGVRRSNIQPSRSAILGLLGAAVGVGRNEEEKHVEFSASLGIAVKLYSGGSLLTDYHTVQVPQHESKVAYYTRQSELVAGSEKIGTILSSREYRCDSLSLVAIYNKNKDSKIDITELDYCLRNPVYHLYYGRKSCVPALPLAPIIIKAKTVKEAFSGYSVVFPQPVNEEAPDWLRKSFCDYTEKTLYDDSVFYYWENGVESGFEKELQSVERYDQPLSRKRWQFTSRREYMAVERKGAVDVHE